MRILKYFSATSTQFSLAVFLTFSSRKTKNSIFKKLLLAFLKTIREKAFGIPLISPGKVIPSKKTHGHFPNLTLEKLEKMHFFSFFGDVPKMALAIYMRGEKKSWKTKKWDWWKSIRKRFFNELDACDLIAC